MAELDAFGQYKDSLDAHVGAVVDSDTEVVLHGLEVGTYRDTAPIDTLKYPYAFHVLLRQVLANVRRAEASGFDAVALASYAEPFLREARSIVDIPVVSMAESTLLASCSVARRATLVSVTTEIAAMADRIVESHGLTHRIATIEVIEPPLNEPALAAAFADPDDLIAAFHRAARKGIDSGADVVIPAEGVLNELLFANSISEIDGVCVMDALGVTLLHTAMLARLHHRTGLHVGRTWEYAKPPPEMLARLASVEDGTAEPNVRT